MDLVLLEAARMSIAVETLTDRLIAEIRRARVVAEPFPHFTVDEMLPADLYAQVMRAVADRKRFRKVDYPGTGRGKLFGWAYNDLKSAPDALRVVHDAFASESFSRAMLEKFRPQGIPADKHKHFVGSADYTTVFDLQIDLPGYEILPHADVRQKIVTFQLYMVPDDAVADCAGTHLCAPRDGRAMNGRPAWASRVGKAIDRFAPASVQGRLEQTHIGQLLSMGGKDSWLPWRWFTTAKLIRAVPNGFMAFAPNERSFHAVKFEGRPGQERPVLRGFIRSGSNTKNWIAPHEEQPAMMMGGR